MNSASCIVARLEALAGGQSGTSGLAKAKLGAVDRVLRVLNREARLSGSRFTPAQPQEPPEELPGKVYINFPMDDI